MHFVSTRGGGEAVTAAQAVLSGTAPDGGLYAPDALPDFSAPPASGETYGETALRVLRALLPGLTGDTLRAAADACGASFSDPEVVPLVPAGDAFILELFHGPTAAFKDVALQALPHLLRGAMQELAPDDRMLVVVATSGDTGSAAMRGFRDLPGFRALVYYPENGVSAVQAAQMRTMEGGNLDAIGIRGNFDDAQAGVKAFFRAASGALPAGTMLGSANSINIGRLVPQIVYYLRACGILFASGAKKPGDTADFCVPTGNFGDILAGYLAKRMGAPIGTLVCASNANRVLYDFLTTGVYDRRRPLHRTLSPSMDILVSGNLERLLYFASGGDAEMVRGLMESLAREGRFTAPDSLMDGIREDFTAAFASDEDTLAAMQGAWREHGYLLDPHAAAAWHAMRMNMATKRRAVVLATASPFKFPRAVMRALNLREPKDDDALPERLGDMLRLPVPPALRGLWNKPVLRDDVIPKENLVANATERVWAWR